MLFHAFWIATASAAPLDDCTSGDAPNSYVNQSCSMSSPICSENNGRITCNFGAQTDAMCGDDLVVDQPGQVGKMYAVNYTDNTRISIFGSCDINTGGAERRFCCVHDNTFNDVDTVQLVGPDGYTEKLAFRYGSRQLKPQNGQTMTARAFAGEGGSVMDGSNRVGGYTEEFFGNDGVDVITARNGHDLLVGGGEDDRLYGGMGNDRIEGGEGDDWMEGGNNEDVLLGGPGADDIFGQHGNDILKGEGERDVLKGGTGHDILHGGLGSDTLIGQGGSDHLCETILLAPGEPTLPFNTMIGDFESSLDLGNNFDTAWMDDGGTNQTHITFGNNDIEVIFGAWMDSNLEHANTIVLPGFGMPLSCQIAESI